MRLSPFLLVFLIVSLVVLTFSVKIPFVNATGQNWLSSWGYRQSVTVNTASGAGTNYQVNITAYYGSGTDSGYKVYLNSHSRTDFGDVRFTASDGSTLLNYWMQSEYASANASFWVKVTGNLTATSSTVYVYYGNLGATTTSSGTNTFLLFDDFLGTTLNTSKWSIVGTGSVTVANSIATISPTMSTDSELCIESTSTFGLHTRMLMSSYSNFAGSSTTEVCDNLGYTDASQNNTAILSKDNLMFSGNYYLYTLNKSVQNDVSTSLPWDNAKHTFMVERASSSTVYGYIDNGHSVSSTADVPTGNLMVTADSWVGYEPNSSINATIYVDWVAIAKYVNPGPSLGSWSNEQAFHSSLTYQTATVSTSATHAFLPNRQTLQGMSLSTLSGRILSSSRQGQQSLTIPTWITRIATAARLVSFPLQLSLLSQRVYLSIRSTNQLIALASLYSSLRLVIRGTQEALSLNTQANRTLFYLRVPTLILQLSSQQSRLFIASRETVQLASLTFSSLKIFTNVRQAQQSFAVTCEVTRTMVFQRFPVLELAFSLETWPPSPYIPSPPVIVPPTFLPYWTPTPQYSLVTHIIDLFGLNAAGLTVKIVRMSDGQVLATLKTNSKGQTDPVSLASNRYSVEVYQGNKLQIQTILTLTQNTTVQLQIGIPVAITFTQIGIIIIAVVSIVSVIAVVLFKRR